MPRTAIATAAVLVVVASASGARAATPDLDPWLGRDKLLHFAGSATLAAGGYVLGASLLEARGHALIVGGSLALSVGIAKEALDMAGLGDPSWKDLAWDVVGTAAGLAVAWSADLLVRGVSDTHPLLVAPHAGREGAGVALQLTF